MTIKDQLHQSATHAAGSDPACPVCAPLMADAAAGLTAELYVTTAEHEAHQLSGQLAACLIRNRVSMGHVQHTNDSFYTVHVADEALDRARAVRRRLFGS